MKRSGYILALSLVLTVVSYGMVFAHGTEKHDKSVSDNVKMQKLHAMMPMFSGTLTALESAIKKNDSTAVHTEIEKILTAIPDLKKSRPHKNVKQKKKFIELASNLEKALNATASKANNNDFAGAMSSFKEVEDTCAACHAKFRD